MGCPGDREYCAICNIWWKNSATVIECPMCISKNNEYKPDLRCQGCTYEDELGESSSSLEDLHSSYSKLNDKYIKLDGKCKKLKEFFDKIN
jgi:predicted nuclease with TOPRIM domain